LDIRLESSTGQARRHGVAPGLRLELDKQRVETTGSCIKSRHSARALAAGRQVATQLLALLRAKGTV
jgi:hypothetical protein